MAKFIATAMFAASAVCAFAAIPVRWTTDTYKVKPLAYECYHGETLDLAAALTAYGEPLALGGKTARLYWQTNGMASAWWSTNAAVRVDSATGATNVLAAVFLGSFDTGAKSVIGFVGVEGENYRSAFELKFRDSPGFTPNTLPPPRDIIDCERVTFLHPEAAPFGGGGVADLTPATNFTSEVASGLTNYVNAKSGLNTNAVKQLIESETGGTNTILHAESDPTVPDWAKAEDKPSYTAAEVGAVAPSGENEVDNNFIIRANDGYVALERTGDDTYGMWKGHIHAKASDLSFALDYGGESKSYSDIMTAADDKIAPVAAAVAGWENYWTGDKVRISITNYYGGTSGEPPRMRVEEFSHSVTNGTAVTNVYRVVWDELTRQTNYQHQIDVKVDGISNTVMTAAFMQTSAQLAGKAPRAWGEVTSAGAAAPPGMVWHTEPNTMFAGGTEYAHVAVGEGVICVLADSGAPVYTEGEEGKFRFKDDSGQYYFGFDVRESYTIGCRTDGISVAGGIVSLTYDLISADNPEVLHTATLTNATWEVQTVTWEQNPPAGTKICYINVGDAPSGFYKAQMTYAGGAKFVTNMGAEFQGGIMATNETGVTTATQLPIYPAITSTGVVWRVNWGN